MGTIAWSAVGTRQSRLRPPQSARAMNIICLSLLALILTLSVCGLAVAADPFDSIDTDHNGIISESEAQAAGRALSSASIATATGN